MSTFLSKLSAVQQANRSWVCVGLDPVMERLPEAVRHSDEPLLEFSRAIVEATADLVCAYKPNLAFWLAEGPDGLRQLRALIACVPEHIPVILDAKFNDVGHTAAAYARAALDMLGADAVTANPYLGIDALRPFLAQEKNGLFLLARTSNPSAPDLQDRLVGNQPLYAEVAHLAVRWNAELAGTCGLVVGATYPDELAHLRQVAPELPFLIPGIGAQGGSLEAAVEHGPTAEGVGPIINSSREIIYASNGADFAQAARTATAALRERITGVRQQVSRPTGPSGTKVSLAARLFDAGCIQFGTFTLKSGLTSPIYIDLRLLAGHPRLLRDVARAMAEVAAGLTFDRIAAIPYAGLPIGTALALEMGLPLIYPRQEVKAHGTRRAIEGAYAPGERVLLVDDLITRGDSKLEAIAPLEEAGLSVHDVLVLIDREQGGAEDLSRRGYRLHAVLRLTEILAILEQLGRITSAQHQEVLHYLKAAA
ncbi:MAG: orotidine-5'-phosphate decarboxylase [Anaerolineae bacterium]|nr:orotidine-5'-phosphate decarboxylase [Anaerolineae bacterium]